jgi:DNA ligase-1
MFKPLLSATYDPRFAPNYPVAASPKLDGIRVIIVDGVPMTRSLKHPLPNDFIRNELTGLPWFDGEIIIGDPSEPETCARTQSGVMSKSNPELEVNYTFFIFDLADPTQAQLTFGQRFNGLTKIRSAIVESKPHLAERLYILPHTIIADGQQLWNYERACVDQGYEGIMLRGLDGRYKHGRSTAKERILTKIKRWEDAEAIIIDVHEEMHNANEAVVTPTGKTERSSHQENKVGKGTLGGYTCITNRDSTNLFGLEHDGGQVQFYLGAAANMKAEQRVALWQNRADLIGKKVTFKYQATDGAEKPRFPVFKNFRNDE